jgi:hypothetical protein
LAHALHGHLHVQQVLLVVGQTRGLSCKACSARRSDATFLRGCCWPAPRGNAKAIRRWIFYILFIKIIMVVFTKYKNWIIITYKLFILQ